MSNPKELSETLMTALAHMRLPMRGWVLKFTNDPVPDDGPNDPRPYPLYASPPQLDEDGVVVGTPDIETYVPAVYTTFQGSFCFTADPIMVNGHPFHPPQQMIFDQLAHFFDTKEMLSFSFDPRPIKVYKTMRVLPDPQRFKELTAQWSQKHKTIRSQEDVKKARFMLGQLGKIKENTHHVVQQGVGELASTIAQNEPDYWELVEKLISGKITPDDALKSAKGALIINVSPTYNPPTPIKEVLM
jgi:hypothetical protein